MKYYGLGRRKSAVAQVYISSLEKRSTKEFAQLDPKATGAGRPKSGLDPLVIRNISENIIINQKNFFDYFQNDQNLIQSIQQIFQILDQPLHIRVIRVTVSGGGSTGQKEAIRLALARALRQCHSIFKKKNY